jgi:hypothetical protein
VVANGKANCSPPRSNVATAPSNVTLRLLVLALLHQQPSQVVPCECRFDMLGSLGILAGHQHIPCQSDRFLQFSFAPKQVRQPILCFCDRNRIVLLFLEFDDPPQQWFGRRKVALMNQQRAQLT